MAKKRPNSRGERKLAPAFNSFQSVGYEQRKRLTDSDAKPQPATLRRPDPGPGTTWLRPWSTLGPAAPPVPAGESDEAAAVEMPASHACELCSTIKRPVKGKNCSTIPSGCLDLETVGIQMDLEILIRVAVPEESRPFLLVDFPPRERPQSRSRNRRLR